MASPKHGTVAVSFIVWLGLLVFKRYVMASHCCSPNHRLCAGRYIDKPAAVPLHYNKPGPIVRRTDKHSDSTWMVGVNGTHAVVAGAAGDSDLANIRS